MIRGGYRSAEDRADLIALARDSSSSAGESAEGGNGQDLSLRLILAGLFPMTRRGNGVFMLVPGLGSGHLPASSGSFPMIMS